MKYPVLLSHIALLLSYLEGRSQICGGENFKVSLRIAYQLPSSTVTANRANNWWTCLTCAIMRSSLGRRSRLGCACWKRWEGPWTWLGPCPWLLLASLLTLDLLILSKSGQLMLCWVACKCNISSILKVTLRWFSVIMCSTGIQHISESYMYIQSQWPPPCNCIFVWNILLLFPSHFLHDWECLLVLE